MNRIGLATLALGVLAAAGLAAAAAMQTYTDFHGVRVLADFDKIVSGAASAAPVTAVFGPYDTDAVLLVKWGGEINYSAAKGLMRPQFELLHDGVLVEANKPSATFEGGSIRLRRDERLFLKHGEVKTITAEAEEPSAVDARATVLVRLEVAAIATPQ